MEDSNFSVKQQLWRKQLDEGRSRLLSFAFLSFLVALIFLFFLFTLHTPPHFLLYTVTGLVYLVFYKVWARFPAVVLVASSLFYLLHTYLEFRLDLNFEFLRAYGLEAHATSARATSLTLVLLDAVRLLYPYLRVALVVILLVGWIPYLKLKKG
ncbi:hypothetical protein SAMN05421823_12316 [Catalinimonas alkaloidigena]|uniref:Uncharacterized protein n=1 Tax=Catalinimonas alkaloidigena TaxID=1075417 RepID=A0A1G9VS58_9BACT|nr:hypothetical protein [Catalinimonas alkaloidigena]SDM75000.1 hypothetical protein SAMN05421823_12316 [Catalinimonas alkaloidigena]